MPRYDFVDPGQPVVLKDGSRATIWIAELAPFALCIEKATGRTVFPVPHHEFRDVPGHEGDPDDD